MSHRSILLSTTFAVALVSLASVAPASAHGFGFGGFSGGPPMSFRAYGGSLSRGPMPSMGGISESSISRLPTGAASRINNGASHIEPSRTPMPAASTISATGNARYPVGGETGRPSTISSVETGGRLPKTGGSEGVPNVTGNPRILGQGPTPDHGPGISNVPSNGPTVNLPGSQGLGQKGPRVVPGYEGIGNGPQVNLPGSVNRNAADEAAKALAKAEDNGKQLLDEVGKGGPNSVNLPTYPGAGVDVSDDTNGKKPASGGSSGSGSGGTGKTTGSGGSGSGSGGTGKATGSADPVKIAPGVYGSNGSGPTKDGGTQTDSTMVDGKTTTQVVATTTKDGSTTVTYREKGKDGKVTEISSGPSLPSKPSAPGKKNNTPNDEDGGNTIGALNPSSGIGKTGHGGGTDNNGTETSTQATQLNGAVVSRTGHGDGTGNHGDNNTVDKSGALSANTSMARKDYGDGGSDTRDGGTSLAAPRVGGGPHQNAAAAAAMAD